MMALRRENLKALLLGAAVLVVGVLAAYSIGRGLERVSVQKQTAAMASDLAGANTRVAMLESRVELLAANVWVYRASTALDNRNFGVANQAMANAVGRLSKVDAASANLEPNALAAVKRDASALKITVATDLQPQRAQLLKLAASVTELAGSSNQKNFTTK